MKKPISYSSYSTYMQCPAKWDLHYNQKLRPEKTSSALVFGAALDQGFNTCLERHMGLSTLNPLDVVKRELKKLHDQKVEYVSADYDRELIPTCVESSLRTRAQATGWTGDDVDGLAKSLIEKQVSGQELSVNQNKVLNMIMEAALFEKASIMVNAFINQVLPMIEEVHSVQTQVKRGILDFEATIKGYGRCVVDNKTSARPYERDAVKWSVQLAGYGAKKAMYLVFDKNIRKNRTKTCSTCGFDGTGGRHKTCSNEVNKVRCGGEWAETIRPEVVVQIVADDVSEHNRAMVEKAYQDTEKLIESGAFPKNLTACKSQFGRPCPYIKLCWDGDSTDLVKKEEGK